MNASAPTPEEAQMVRASIMKGNASHIAQAIYGLLKTRDEFPQRTATLPLSQHIQYALLERCVELLGEREDVDLEAQERKAALAVEYVRERRNRSKSGIVS